MNEWFGLERGKWMKDVAAVLPGWFLVKAAARLLFGRPSRRAAPTSSRPSPHSTAFRPFVHPRRCLSSRLSKARWSSGTGNGLRGYLLMFNSDRYGSALVQVLVFRIACTQQLWLVRMGVVLGLCRNRKDGIASWEC